MRIRTQSGAGQTTVRILMSHEMESGQRKDAEGKIIPAWHIQDVSARLDGREIFTAQWGPSVSKNPYLQFIIKGTHTGSKLSVTWRDSRGDSRTDEVTVA
jgi:sulfur-oxidizing protein SoxZ